jgi:hypothetical protein
MMPSLKFLRLIESFKVPDKIARRSSKSDKLERGFLIVTKTIPKADWPPLYEKIILIVKMHCMILLKNTLIARRWQDSKAL